MFYTGGVAKRRAHGEGSIYQIQDGTWRAIVPLGNGKRRYLRAQTRAELVRKTTAAKSARDAGRPTSRESVAAYLDRWLVYVRTAVRPRTADGYASHVEHHLRPALGDIRLVDLKPEHVHGMMTGLAEQGLAPLTITHVHATLRRALTQAERWALVQQNVARLVQQPRRPPRELDPLTPDEARALLRAVNGHRLRALYAVALALGLRQGEALGLRWSDIDVDQGQMTVRYQLQRRSLTADAILLTPKAGLVPTKTHRSQRSVALPPAIVANLVEHRRRQDLEREVAGTKWVETGLVFTTAHGTPLDGPRLTRQLHKILADAGLPDRRWHDLRHSCGSILAAHGVPLPEIQRILGHAQITTTGVYLHSLSDAQRAAAQRMQDVLFGPDRSE